MLEACDVFSSSLQLYWLELWLLHQAQVSPALCWLQRTAADCLPRLNDEAGPAHTPHSSISAEVMSAVFILLSPGWKTAHINALIRGPDQSTVVSKW